jgi:hypothetical protein
MYERDEQSLLKSDVEISYKSVTLMTEEEMGNNIKVDLREVNLHDVMWMELV